MTGDTITAERRAFEDGLVREHLRLVDVAVNHLSRRLPRHVQRDELASAGMAALAFAARSFDPERDTSFSHYASVRLRGALLDELRSRDWASRSVRRRARTMQQASDELTSRLGRPPTIDELAAALGSTTRVVDELSDDVHRATVLNYESVTAEGGGELVLPTGGDATPEDVVLDRERHAFLLDAVAALPERLRRVVIGCFFEDRTSQDVAAELGVSPSRVSQMRTEALKLLHDGITMRLDPERPAPDRPARRVPRRRLEYRATVAAKAGSGSKVVSSRDAGLLRAG